MAAATAGTCRYRWVDEDRYEVLARLLKLNRTRAEEEEQSAAAAPATKRCQFFLPVLSGDQPFHGVPESFDGGVESQFGFSEKEWQRLWEPLRKPGHTTGI